MKKETAIEWLKDWMGKNQYFIGNDLLEAIEQAKAMEERQIIAAYLTGRDDEDTAHSDWTFERTYEDYYRETYGDNK